MHNCHSNKYNGRGWSTHFFSLCQHHDESKTNRMPLKWILNLSIYFCHGNRNALEREKREEKSLNALKQQCLLINMKCSFLFINFFFLLNFNSNRWWNEPTKAPTKCITVLAFPFLWSLRTNFFPHSVENIDEN